MYYIIVGILLKFVAKVSVNSKPSLVKVTVLVCVCLFNLKICFFTHLQAIYYIVDIYDLANNLFKYWHETQP